MRTGSICRLRSGREEARKEGARRSLGTTFLIHVVGTYLQRFGLFLKGCRWLVVLWCNTSPRPTRWAAAFSAFLLLATEGLTISFYFISSFQNDTCCSNSIPTLRYSLIWDYWIYPKIGSLTPPVWENPRPPMVGNALYLCSSEFSLPWLTSIHCTWT